ncbi:MULTISPECIES: peptidase domain-containing ABC transporter [unclassified Mucilaginibacter]|uniref:peptidase domain-containing ABC transporter n=1 Tax=unclassified Mucilaginibacter TaxID=2617802 RepID=UPI002AC98436|nr:MULTISPECIES: peptidase domain-containing ABC transporter [unclassified Mucilaginibacter]MEB0280867.1 peptidase domain-containing ABC transporter [Mucilaginibacter sp. 10B2]MEB0302752.1 peptidase domain-containing ABC transporter [Mucilaginibacter sp. 5C4]WPX25650.1 peptidase domain-containing ABC transporter [Mucilaginibacter sp. 5C4]
MRFKFHKQYDGMDCGPACLRMICTHYDRQIPQHELTKMCEINREGTSLLGIANAAEEIGFSTAAMKLQLCELKDIPLPAILHWRQNHFVLLYKISKERYYIADPAVGKLAIPSSAFEPQWLIQGSEQGIVLVLEPQKKIEKNYGNVNFLGFSNLFHQLKNYRYFLLQLFFGLLVGCILQLLLPILTQAVVDVGIKDGNLNFLYILLLGQLMIVIGRVSVDYIRSWLLLHISSRINISILSQFVAKLARLPMSFFDSKLTGDIMQRMNDQKKIENFLTGSTITAAFSILTLGTYSILLCIYDVTIFFIFITGGALYTCWLVFFLKTRREMNSESFEINTRNQNSIMQLINGMQEIKLTDCEREKRWGWERIQVRLFHFNIRNLKITQYQQGGATMITESVNIIITFLSAKSVINGQLSLGSMLAIQYIVGQLISPVQQILQFVQSYQDAKISLERLNEIHALGDEEPMGSNLLSKLPSDNSISIQDVSFRYPGAGNPWVLRHVNLRIPEGKTTAIVGSSGSGKTTMLKLILRFYNTHEGSLFVGDSPIDSISFKHWRNRCGVVMQEGFIFSDTIENNIAVSDKVPDPDRLEYAQEIANIKEFIHGLPLGLKTKIGVEGNGISAGQKQRILIARAVYKDPDYILFDEATNALDANNERQIINNLNGFFKGKTVVIVAHRLSTVSHADNIIVLDQGKVIEQGTHESLCKLNGYYYHLVKNQLELGV